VLLSVLANKDCLLKLEKLDNVYFCACLQVLWGEKGLGTSADSVAAFEKAVADGVDVINYRWAAAS
jgi:hypothetical protein